LFWIRDEIWLMEIAVDGCEIARGHGVCYFKV
jgi:hypothetical protein